MDETESPALRAEIDALLTEHGGNARAVIAALLHDLAMLASDAESRTSRGYVRGRFARRSSMPIFDGTAKVSFPAACKAGREPR